MTLKKSRVEKVSQHVEIESEMNHVQVVTIQNVYVIHVIGFGLKKIICRINTSRNDTK